MKYILKLEKLEKLIIDGEKCYKDYKNLFCYATRIEEKELDNLLLRTQNVNLTTIQNICQYSILTLDDFFEKCK